MSKTSASKSAAPYFSMRRTGKQWYWRVKAGNNKSIAIGGEGYHNEADLLKVLPRVVAAIQAKLEMATGQRG